VEEKTKSKEQLLHELAEVRRQIAALKKKESRWKQTGDALIEEKNKMQSLVDSLEYGVTIQDREYNIIFQNKTMQNLFGHLGEKCYRIYEFHEGVCEGCPGELPFRIARPTVRNDGYKCLQEKPSSGKIRQLP